MSNIDSLHRAMIAAGLRYDEANAHAVDMAERAKSMLAADLSASLQAEREARRAFMDHCNARERFQAALRAEESPSEVKP